MPDGKTASPQLAALLPRLEPFALPCIRIKATPANSLTLTDAKFGGYPYWPAGKPYPADSEGRYLYLLAQLNFAQIPKLEGYPDKGLLQFYIGADDLYGMNFDAPTRQEDFRVVYFEDFDAAPIADFSFLDVQELESGMPLKGSMQLAFAPGKDYFSFADFRFSDETAESLIADAEPVKGQHLLEEELTRLYPDEGHKMGGYAYFTQTDPRQDDPAYDDYILLLQVDSQLPDICWGDAGVGNFFIHRADLERRDFSRVLYNWDCT
ncbi:hypothetical protein BUE76_21505 [Cnuella takakiae]|nr:hypothetical protein BUE76_21505 [Cnuella takakiae]